MDEIRKPPRLSAEDVTVNNIARKYGIDIAETASIAALREAYRAGQSIGARTLKRNNRAQRLMDCLDPWYVGLLHGADGFPEWPDYRDPDERREYRDGYRAGRSPTHRTRTLYVKGTPS